MKRFPKSPYAKANRHTFRIACMICLTWPALAAAEFRSGNTVLFSARELRARNATIEAPGAGEFFLYVWAKGGETIPVAVGDQRVGDARAPGKGGNFGWTRVGSATLEKGHSYRIRLGKSDARTEPMLKELVGYVLLSDRKDLEPGRLFEIARVFSTTPEKVDDRRVTEFRHKDKPYPAAKYESKKQWERKADFIRKQILVATGLWPLPERTPLHVRRFGKIDREGYSIEKVYFESFPGFYATGNLYMPRGRKPPYPAVLCPHGHWKDGRLANEKNGSVPGRCINLARQGHVVFSIDMVGYNDSKQVTHRSKFSYPLWGLSIMGLQLWNGMRAVDFLLSIDGVDPDRIGCTGASGGGTQTFILAAVDDRIRVAVPVCMVSAHFQGGCECENAPLLRLSTYNVEIAAAAAPRAYMLTGATGDWTKNVMTVEGPRVQEIYRLLDAEEKFNHVIVKAGHNYNQETREHVYAWMGRWLLGETDAEKLREQPFKLETREDMLVFTKEHPLPKEALSADGVRDYLIERAKKQIASLKPKDRDSWKRFRTTYATGLLHALLARPFDDLNADAVVMGRTDGDRWMARKLMLQPAMNAKIPAVLWEPKGRKATRAAVVVHPAGKMGLADPATGEPGALVAGLLEAGAAVLSPDCFLTGEFHTPFEETKRALPDTYAYTYNPTTLAWRVADIVSALLYMEKNTGSSDVDLVGLGAAGPWCLLVAAIGDPPEKVRIVVDANGFNDADDAGWQGDMFQPGIRAFGGLRVAGALAAPTSLMIHNTQGKLDTGWIAGVYRAAGAEGALRAQEDRASEKAILQWLTEPSRR